MRDNLRVLTTEEEALKSSPWEHLRIPVIEPTGWTPHQVGAGIRSLDRLRAELDAATALLVGARPDDRDATAALSRLSNITNKESRKRRGVAAVVTAFPRALDLLRTGALTIDHVAALRAVVDKTGAAQLLESGVGCHRRTSVVPCRSSGLRSSTGKIRRRASTRLGHCASRRVRTG